MFNLVVATCLTLTPVQGKLPDTTCALVVQLEKFASKKECEDATPDIIANILSDKDIAVEGFDCVPSDQFQKVEPSKVPKI